MEWKTFTGVRKKAGREALRKWAKFSENRARSSERQEAQSDSDEFRLRFGALLARA